MNNRLDFFKRLTAFLLAMLLVTTMMGDDFFSLATSDEIITEESVKTGDSSSAPEAAPAPEAVDIPQEPAPSEPGQVVEPTTADSEIPVEPQPTVDENGNPIVVPTEEQPKSETPSEPKESIDDAEVTPNPENIDKPETDKTNEEDIEDPDAKDKEEGIDDEEELVKEEEEECEHEWKYVSNGNGTHFRKCSKCDEEGEQEDCDYDENGVCLKCGYEDNSLVFQTFSKEILGTTITVEGYMPRNADVTIYYVGKKAIENIVNENLDEGIFKAYAAYDITIYDRNGNKYQPDYDNNAVKVTFESVHNLEEVPDEEVTVFRVEDDNSVTEIEADAAGEDVSFDAEHFSTYVTGKVDNSDYVEISDINQVAFISAADSGYGYTRPVFAGFDFYADAIGDYVFTAKAYKNLTSDNPTSGDLAAESDGTFKVTVDTPGWKNVKIPLVEKKPGNGYVSRGYNYSVVVGFETSPSNHVFFKFNNGSGSSTYISKGDSWKAEPEHNGIFKVTTSASVVGPNDYYTLEVTDTPTDAYTIASVKSEKDKLASEKVVVYAVGETDTLTAVLSEATAERTIDWTLDASSSTIISLAAASNPMATKITANSPGSVRLNATYKGTAFTIDVYVVDIKLGSDSSVEGTTTHHEKYTGTNVVPAVTVNTTDAGGAVPSYYYVTDTTVKNSPTATGVVSVSSLTTPYTITKGDSATNVDAGTSTVNIKYYYSANKVYSYDRSFTIDALDISTKNAAGKDAFDTAEFVVENGTVTDVKKVNENNVLAATPSFSSGDITVSLVGTPVFSSAGIKYTYRVVGHNNFTGQVDVEKQISGSNISDIIRAEIRESSPLYYYEYTGMAYNLNDHVNGDSWTDIAFYDKQGNELPTGTINKNNATATINSSGTIDGDSINAGEKEIVITPSSGFSGSISIPFTIYPRSLSDAKIIWVNGREFSYTGNPIEPKECTYGSTDGDFYVTLTTTDAAGNNVDNIINNTNEQEYKISYLPTNNHTKITDSPTLMLTATGKNFENQSNLSDGYSIKANYALNMTVRIIDGGIYNGTYEKKDENGYYPTGYKKYYDKTDSLPTIKVLVGGNTISANTDYDIEVDDDASEPNRSSDLTAAVGTKYIKITAKEGGKYAGGGTVIATYTVVPRPLKNEVITVVDKTSSRTKIFNNATQGLVVAKDDTNTDYDIKITYGTTYLIYGQDYDISYTGDQVNAGTVNYTITGKGNYTGSLDPKSFTIKPASLDATTGTATAELDFADPVISLSYDGKEKNPTVKVKINNSTFTETYKYTGATLESTNFKVSYDNNIALSTSTKPATVTVTGKNNLTGSVRLTFNITSSTDKYQITLNGKATTLVSEAKFATEHYREYYCDLNAVYNGTTNYGAPVVINPATNEVLNKNGRKTDYGYAYYNTDKVNPSKPYSTTTWPYLKITGINSYDGNDAIVYFNIRPVSIKDATISYKYGPECDYDSANVVVPTFKITFGTNELKAGTDYSVEAFEDEACTEAATKKAGPKYARITGQGIYEGSVIKPYTVGTDISKALVRITGPDPTVANQDIFIPSLTDRNNGAIAVENTSTESNPFKGILWRNNKAAKIELYDGTTLIDGNKLKAPVVTSKFKDGTDVSYISRNTTAIDDYNYNVITYTVSAIESAGKYYGTATIYYQIEPATIGEGTTWDNKVTGSIQGIHRYDGDDKKIYPEVKFKYGEAPEYVLTDKDLSPYPINLGKIPTTQLISKTIYGVGNFTGSHKYDNINYYPGYVKVTAKWNDSADGSKTIETTSATTTEDLGQIYKYEQNKAQCPDISLTATNGTTKLVEGTDYDITYPSVDDQKNKLDENLTITINVKGTNYVAQTITFTYKIASNNIAGFYGTLSDIPYTATTVDIKTVKKATLKLATTKGGAELKPGIDYELVEDDAETQTDKFTTQFGINKYKTAVVTKSLPSYQTNYIFVKGIGIYSGYCKIPFNIVLDIGNDAYAKVTIPNHYYNLKEDGLTTTNPVVPDIKYLAQDKTTWVSLDKPEDNCTVIRSADKKNSPGPDPNLAVEGKNICKNTATEVKYYDTSTNTSYPVCFRADLANLAEQGIIKLTSGAERAYTGSPVTATVSGLGDAVEMKSDALQGDYSIVYTTDPTALNTSVEPIAVKTYYVVVKAPAANIWQSQYFIPESNTGNKLSFKIKYDLSTATIKYYHNGQVVNDNTIPYEGRPMPVPAIITVGSDNVPIYNYNNSDNPLVSLNESTVELVGKYTIIATPKDENQVCGTLISPDFYVSGIDINRCTVTLTHPSVPYTGNPIEESAVGVTVKFNDKTLTRNTDYTLDFVNNLDAGTATINLKGINGYSGVYANPITFTITPVEITSEMVSVETGYYQGYDQEVKPAVTIKNGNHTLLLDTDYKLGDYNNNKAITTENTKASVIIKAGTSGNYKVTNPNGLKIEYDILQLDLATAKIQIDPKSAEWTGEELKVEDIIKSVTTSSGIVLRSEKDDSTAYDYIIKVLNNANTKTMLKEQGTYQLRIEGKNNCTGYLQVPFEITARSLANNYHYYYSSSSTSTGFIGTWTYMQDLDGDTTNGAQPGYITQGSYTDSNGNDVPECLTIKVYDCTTVNDGVDNIPKVEIVDSGVKDSGKDYQLVSGTDFTVSVTNAKTAGSAIWNRTVTADKHATVADGCPTVTITGTGRYMDSISIPFNIGKNINNLGLTVVYTITGAVDVANTAISKPTYTYVEANKDKAAWAYTYNGVEQKPTNISVKYKPVGATSEVPLSTDNYDISYENVNGNEDASVDAGYKYITITGKGDYCGTISQRYQINRKSITAIINKTNNNFPANKVFTNENPMIATSDGTATGKKVLSFAVSGSSVSRMTGSSTTTNTAKTYLVDTKKMNQTEADKFAGYYYAVYDKDPIKPTVTVTDHTLGIHGTSSAVLTDKDIELTYANNNKVSEFVLASNAVSNYTPAIINVSFKGSAANDFTSGGNYYVPEGTTSTYQIEFLIVIHNLSKDFYAQLLNETGDELTEPNFKYDNGKAFRPKVKVTNGTQVLTEGQDNDYILEYENNVRPGEATVTVTGVNNYMGTKTLHYTIWADLADTEIYYKSEGVYVQGTPEQLYTGKAIDYGVPRIYLALPIENNVTEIKPLIEGKDYYAVNPNSDNAFLTGGSITYRGSTKYWVGDKGPIDYKVTFDKSLIDVDGITEGQEFKYTGDVIKPEMTLNVSTAKAEPTIYYRNYGKENQELLDSDDDFVKIGTITAVIKYKLGEESGEIEKTYKIVPRPIYDCKVVYTENNRYTGYQIKPSVSVFIVSDNGVKTLEEGTQYKVEYGENIYSLCTLKVTGCCDEITSSKTYFPKINLGAPVNLKTTADGSSVTATWVHDIYTAGEEVEIIKASTNELIALKKIEGTKGTCTFDGLENVTNYIVKIRSYQYIGESKELKYSSDWDNAKQSSVTTGIATSEMSVESNAVGKVTIKWDPDGDVVIYKIYRAESADASDKGTKIAVFPASTGVYTNSNLDKKSPYVSDYWYYIEGYAIINNELTLVSTSEKMHVTVMQ